MKTQAGTTSALERLPSGIPGFDVILGGGFFGSGVYIIHGTPGSGKTIFANQLCFAHVAAGGRAVYITLLAESHSRMLQHIGGLDFFDEAVIPLQLSYISAFKDLETEGLKGLMAVLRREMRALSATVLVLDGLVAAADAAESDSELKKFIHEIQTTAVFQGCTVFLLTSGSPQRVNAEHTMVDGLIELDDRLFEVRSERSLQVRKFRGARALRGKHAFQISDRGLQVFPRIESLFVQPPGPGFDHRGLSTGIAKLDALIGTGGFPEGSVTVVVGSTGTGKTTTALHFLSASTAQEPGLLFGFFESPDRLKASGHTFGLGLAELEARGIVEFMWAPQGEHMLDELAHRVFEAVDRRGVKRLVIDGLAAFFEAATHTERLGRFFASLTNELRRRGVTQLLTLETRDVVSSVLPTPHGISALVDNLLFLRFVESNGEVKRLLSLMKIRSTHFNPGVHAFEINSRGLTIHGRYTAGGDVLPSAEPVTHKAPTDSPPATPGAKSD